MSSSICVCETLVYLGQGHTSLIIHGMLSPQEQRRRRCRFMRLPKITPIAFLALPVAASRSPKPHLNNYKLLTCRLPYSQGYFETGVHAHVWTIVHPMQIGSWLGNFGKIPSSF